MQQDYFRDLPDKEIWLLSETRLRSIDCEQSLSSSANALQGLSFRTTSEAYRELFFRVFRSRSVRVLSEYESQTLLFSCLNAGQARYPVLFEALHHVRSGAVLEDSLEQVYNFIKNFRLYQKSEAFLRETLDAFGNTKQLKKRNEELFLLVQEFSEAMEQQNLFDFVAILESVCNSLLHHDPRALQSLIPSAIVLDHPSHMFPVEQVLWNRMRQLTELRMLLSAELKEFLADANSESLPPSLRYQKTVLSFLCSIPAEKRNVFWVPPTFREREPLLVTILDAKPSTDTDDRALINLGSRSFPDRQSEVRSVVLEVQRLLKEQHVLPSEIHIVVTELEPYFDLLLREAALRSVPLRIPRGLALERTSPAQVLRQYLTWLEQADLSLARDLFTHPFVERKEPDFEAQQAFTKLFSSEIAELEGLGLGPVDSLAMSNEALLAQSWTQLLLYAEQFHLGYSLANWENWIRAFFVRWISLVKNFVDRAAFQQQVKKDFSGTFCVLLVLYEKLVRRDSVLEKAAQLPSAIRQVQKDWYSLCLSSTQRRQTASHFKSQPWNYQACRETLGSIRKIRLTLREVCREMERYPETYAPTKNLQTVSLIAGILKERLTCQYLSSPPQRDVVLATEFLDSRGLIRDHVFVLGLHNRSFPKTEHQTSGSQFDDLSRALHERVGGNDLLYESYSLLRQLLQNCRHVSLSFPRSTEQGETEGAFFFQQLNPATVKNERDIPELKPEDTEGFFLRTALLRQRKSTAFTAFDGCIGPLTETSLRLSVSDIEVLADCPQAFYFKNVLTLHSAATLQSSLGSEVGQIVHRSLEKFFKDFPKQQRELGDRDFGEACGCLREIAISQLQESSLPWDSHPFLRVARENIIAGLDQFDDEGPRGLLKAALILQRDFIKTWPVRCEYQFGKDQAFIVKISGFALHIVGTIDRLDTLESEAGRKLFVWDYKTGFFDRSILRDERRNMQVPIYALVVRRDYGSEGTVRGGGYILLAEGQKKNEVSSSLATGAVQETLTLVKHNGRYRRDESVVEEKLESCASRLEELATVLRDGRFHQIEDSASCPWCAYRKICGRDEAKLHDKLTGVAQPKLIAETIPPEVALEKHSRVPLRSALLSEEQQAASDISQHSVLIAGAGSGKTTVLQTRILKLLLAGVRIESILAITFTEKAAREILGRVEEAIYLALASGEALGETLTIEQRKNLLEARISLPAASIGTIHRFAAQVLRMEPQLSLVERPERVLGGGEQQSILQAIVQNALLVPESSFRGTSLAAFQQGIQRLLDSRMPPRLIHSSLLRLLQLPQYKFKALQKSLGFEGTHFDPRHEHVEEILKKLTIFQHQRVQRQCRRLQQFLENWCRDVQAWMANGATLSDQQSNDFSIIIELVVEARNEIACHLAGEVRNLRQSLEKCLAEVLQRQASAKKKSPKNPRNYLFELRDELAEIDMDFFNTEFDRERESLELSQEICRMATLTRQLYTGWKLQRGIVDYDDIIVEAHRIICGSVSTEREKAIQQSVLDRLRKRYRAIMVDEFQDTDPLQWQMIQTIAEVSKSEPPQANNVPPPTSIFIVGDGKQAIYGFRGGDASVFDKATATILNNEGELHYLRNNYRSHPAIVKFVNSLFEPLFLADFDGENARVSTAVRPQVMQAQREGSEDEERVRVLLSDKEDKEAEVDLNIAEREARKVSKFLLDVLTSIEQPDGASRWAALAASSRTPKIAVLARTGSQLATLAHEFQANGIPFSIFHNNGFFDLEEVVHVENILRALSDPSDAISLVGVLRSPFIALNDQEIFALSTELDDWAAVWQCAPAKCPRFERILHTLQHWRELSRVFGAARLLQTILEEVSLEAVYQNAEQHQEFQNIEQLLGQLRAAEVDGATNGSVRDAIRWIADQRQESSANVIANDSCDPVVLMTIHAAKGLEFPMVVLPFLNTRAPVSREFFVSTLEGELPGGESFSEMLMSVHVDDEDQGQRRETLVSKCIRNHSMAQRRVEEKRIFYVACTRARDYLVLSLAAEKKFLDKQMKRQELTEEERGEALFSADSPDEWLKHLLVFQEGNKRLGTTGMPASAIGICLESDK